MSQIESSATLSHKQIRAIELLVSGESITDSAKSARVARQTLTRWMGMSEFQSALRRAQDDTLQTITRRLVGVAEDCVVVLHDLALSAEKHSDRIRSADAVLTHVLRMTEMLTLADRVKALEDRLSESNHPA